MESVRKFTLKVCIGEFDNNLTSHRATPMFRDGRLHLRSTATNQLKCDSNKNQKKLKKRIKITQQRIKANNQGRIKETKEAMKSMYDRLPSLLI